MSSASWRASRCARRGRATWRSCAARWRLLPALRAALGAARLAAAAASCSRGIGEHDGRARAAARARSPRSRAALLRDGDVIAAGYDAELDELRHIATHTDAFLLELEQRERERTGIAGLKLGFNRVQGFFIEVSRARRRARARRTTCAARPSSPPSASSPPN